MFISLYGKNGLVFQTIAAGFKEGHLQDKLKFDVVEKDKVGAGFKDAVKKTYNAKFLDDADMVIRFAIPKATPVEEPEEEQPKEEPPEEEEKVEVDVEEQPAEENPEADVKEAETTAEGADLKKKIIDTVKRRLFQTDADKIELSDLDGYLEGYDVCFIKVSIKEDDKAVET